MSKAKPKRWVSSKKTVHIAFRKLDGYEDRLLAGDGRFCRFTAHESWEDAYVAAVAHRASALEKAQQELKQAVRALASAERALDKAKSLQPPF